MDLDIRPRSFVLAAGTALATLLPSKTPGRLALQAALVGSANAAAQTMDPRGIQVLAFVPDDHEPGDPVAPETMATTTASWVVANLVVGKLTRRVPGPRIVKALLAGGVVIALDQYVAQAALNLRDRGLSLVPDQAAS